MKSIWQAEMKMHSFPALEGDRKTDVAIIGGGIAGILTAYMLKLRGVECIILEKNEICSGTTGHTTGKITAGQGLIYDKIVSKYGENTASAFYLANSHAIKTLRSFSEDYKCHFEKKDNYVYSLSNRAALEREMRALEKIGADPFFSEKTELPFAVAGAVGLTNQAQFNPLMMLNGIAKELQIYEHTFVREVGNGMLRTDKGRVSARCVIVATHFPFINRRGLYFLKLYQHRSYVLALEGADKLQGMYIDEAEGGLSFRNYGDILLLGGGGHRTGKGGGCYEAVRDAKRCLYPSSEEKYAFAAQDCMSLDGMPYIGRYSAGNANLFVATGFNKWGMSGSAVAANLLADEITGQKNDFSDIFSPRRSMLHSQLLLNGTEALIGLLFPTVKRCSHLGCALHWNRAEHTWDCACHGSRYDEGGRLIDNPSQKDAKIG